MKRVLICLMSIIMSLNLGACTQKEHVTAVEKLVPVKEEAVSSGGAGDEKVLVAYYTWAENAVPFDETQADSVTNPSVKTPGNVQQLAGWVQEETNADLFSIRVSDPYPATWDACLSRANQERGENARPQLVEDTVDISQYDTIFLGYPNWWYGVPMAVLTFLENNDFSGKQVYLFCSHGTGGLARSVELITDAIPDAQISDDIFDCYEEEAASSETAIKDWVNALGCTAVE